MDLAVENTKIVRAIYDVYVASKGQNIDPLIKSLADRSCWCSIGHSDVAKFCKDRHGTNDVRDYFRGLYEDWEMERYDVQDFVAQNDRVIMLGEVAFRHKQTGKLVETKKADIWRLEDGKVIEFYEFFDTARMEAAYG